jgi:hypothetical protein
MGVIEKQNDNQDFKAGVESTSETSCTLNIPQAMDNIIVALL